MGVDSNAGVAVHGIALRQLRSIKRAKRSVDVLRQRRSNASSHNTSVTEGTKNTAVGVISAALLAGVGTLLATNSEYGRHLAKIDVVMEQNHDILKSLSDKANVVPPIVENEMRELRDRLNLHEDRINQIERRKP